MDNATLYPCPICGEMTLSSEEYSFDICKVCGWQEDGLQQKHPDELGPNKQWTLNAAKDAWKNGKTLYARYPNPQTN